MCILYACVCYIIIHVYVCGSVYPWVGMCTGAQYPLKPEEGITSSSDGVMGRYKLNNIGAVNRTCMLWESHLHS